jgi:glucoamylase
LQAQSLEPAITRHWDEKHRMIVPTLDRDAGLEYKDSNLDTAVILGALHSSPARDEVTDGFFTATDDRVLATAERLSENFARLYRVNSRLRDWDGQPMGAAIGRYPEDLYSGEVGPLGNPWFLTTLAFAELYYRCAADWEAQGAIQVTRYNATLFSKFKPLARMMRPHTGESIVASDPRFAAILEGLRTLGDGFMRRARFHADENGAFSEQFNRDSGYMQSAEQLTWSHASLLTAAWAREPKVAR